ncbi:MAG: crosslink repair DNA glycosylase YcaQ family protein [Planctomycetota bacterium]
MVLKRLNLNEFRRRVVAGSFPEFSSLADAVCGLQFIQADPIRAPARAQDLILRQRVASYMAGELEERFPKLDAEEGYLFAYGFATPDVWRALRHRPRAKLKKLERDVLDAVDELGEVHPRDLGERFGRESVQNYWGGKSQKTKRVLEDLHHHGYLRVSRREKGIRIYQVPSEQREPTASPKERYAHLLNTTVRVFGPVTAAFLVSELRSQNHLVKSRRERLAVVESLVQDGTLSEVRVGQETYLWEPNQWESGEVPDRVRILAPFDPLVRDRNRFSHLWNWDYRFEAYVPASKRQRGYYAMPVLFRDQVIGWANATVCDECLQVKIGYVKQPPRAKRFRQQLEAEIESMALFLGLKSGNWTIA